MEPSWISDEVLWVLRRAAGRARGDSTTARGVGGQPSEPRGVSEFPKGSAPRLRS